MEVLLELRVRPDRSVGVLRDGDDRFVTTDLEDPYLDRVEECVQIFSLDPLTVGGLCPEGVAEVQALRADVWSHAATVAGVWIACAYDRTPPDPLAELVFVRADGTHDPLPRPPGEDVLRGIAADQAMLAEESKPESPSRPPTALTTEARAYGVAVASAIAADAERHRPEGPLRRAVIRWFWDDDPRNLTIHLLGTGDEQPSREDAWYPLEWPNVDREFERTERVLGDADVVQAAEALESSMPRDGGGDDNAHVLAVDEVVRLLPAALSARGVALSERFAASAAHFEGWGALDSLQATASPDLLARLAAHGELPDE